MSLKDIMAADINDIFLDQEDGMAIPHIIDGQEIVCIVDEDKSSPTNIDGVYTVWRRLFISQAALGCRPVPGQKMCVDNEYLYVVDCQGEGLIEVILEARES